MDTAAVVNVFESFWENLDRLIVLIPSLIVMIFVSYLLVFAFHTCNLVFLSYKSKGAKGRERRSCQLEEEPRGVGVGGGGGGGGGKRGGGEKGVGQNDEMTKGEVEDRHRDCQQSRSELMGQLQQEDELPPHGAASDDDAVDVIVVGAGLAGSALAFTLGKQGRRVLLLERDLSEPDRIVGELLQPGGYLKLKELGMEDSVEGIDSQMVYGYALLKDGREAKVGYPLPRETYGKDVAGRSFHHGRFIQRLRAKAASVPLVTVKEATVTSLIEDEGGAVRGVKFRTGRAASSSGQEEEALAPLTVICDGCFSRFRKTLSSGKVDSTSCFVGMVLQNCHLPVPNYGHVVIVNPSPILFYPISSTEVRCLVDVPGTKVPSIHTGEMAEHLKTQVLPQLPAKLAKPFLEAVERGHIRSMPNSTLPAAPLPRAGVLLMGDAFNMRHPLTGGGMTVALSDIALLRDMLRPLPTFGDVSAITDYLQAFYTRRKPMAATINTLALALYKVFCASQDAAMLQMREACFGYLSLGGVFSAGTIALLSGLNPRPLSLVFHFFAVALYGVGRLCFPLPSIHHLGIGMRLIKGASNIILPIIKAEGVRQMFFPTTLPAYYKEPPSP
ncbi:hypothetical protein CBR_g61482 [Chara braunii]|uniref:squalene monooxygenase n=1 Tax=Chara braunii TaxID=69332 RepID=A0A388K8U4_CHABU|nr:hypothetical protein CBR_g61482 [Chara braunii]|eukprot:GBG66439.1 hypothetical protein CBR_g61482 [Chara braunii]